MKPRTKQPAATRQAVLDAAGVVFSKQGYSASGIGAIVDACGMTKGALFHHFPDKQALVLAWIDGPLREGISSSWAVSLDAIHSLADFLAFCRKRCHELVATDATSALVSIAAETASVDDVMRDALESVFSDWRLAISSLLQRGQADGWIHPSIQPDKEASIVVSMFAGFSVVFQCNGDENFRRSSAMALEGYLETLRPC